jgi:hypothetical protein
VPLRPDVLQSGVVFYVIVFSILAVLLVVAGLTVTLRRRKALEVEESHAGHATSTSAAARQKRKAQRAQSQHDRRKRH